MPCATQLAHLHPGHGAPLTEAQPVDHVVLHTSGFLAERSRGLLASLPVNPSAAAASPATTTLIPCVTASLAWPGWDVRTRDYLTQAVSSKSIMVMVRLTVPSSRRRIDWLSL